MTILCKKENLIRKLDAVNRKLALAIRKSAPINRKLEMPTQEGVAYPQVNTRYPQVDANIIPHESHEYMERFKKYDYKISQLIATMKE